MPVFNTEVARQTSDGEVIKGIVGRIQKRTLNIDQLKGHNLYKTLEKSACAFTAEDAVTREERIIIAAPQLSSNNYKKIYEAEKDLRDIALKAANNGQRMGMLKNSTAEKFLNEPFKIDLLTPINYTGSKPFTKSPENQRTKTVRDVIPTTGQHEIFLNNRISRRVFIGTSAVTIGGMILNACVPLPINATEISSTVTSGQTSTETSTTKEPTAVPTPTRPEELGGAGGSIYTPDQMDMISNGEFLNQENQYKQWLNNYWGRADNAPFNLKTKELHYVYLFDANKAFVILKAGGDYEGRTFALPIKDGVFMIAPPTTPKGNFNIPVGFGPLEVSGGNYTLAYKNGGLVRIDNQENIVEKLNMQTAKWESYDEIAELAKNFKIEKNWQVKESYLDFPYISYELITSGKLAKIERILIGNPFGPDAKPVNRFYFYTLDNRSLGKTTTLYIDERSSNYREYRENLETRPQKEVVFYRTEVDGVPYFVTTQANLNVDGSVKYLHLIDPIIAIDGEIWEPLNQAYRRNTTKFSVQPVVKLECNKNYPEYKQFFSVCNFCDKNTISKDLFDKWSDSKIMPDELEKHLVFWALGPW